jgi:hypothetical protein
MARIQYTQGDRALLNREKEIKVNFPEKLHGGVYVDNMIISHTRVEFITDFLMVAPTAGWVTSRVIVSPGHVKRILAALVRPPYSHEEA